MRVTAKFIAPFALLISAASGLNAQQLANWIIPAGGREYGADAGDLFELIRFGKLMPDGDVIIADSRGLFVRVYSPNGARTAAFGRKGGGPGEFVGISGLWLAADGRIGVWDGYSHRLSTFERNGTLVATHNIKAPPSMPGSFEFLFGQLRNGDLLLGSLHMARRPQQGELLAERWIRGRFSPQGEFRAPAGEMSGMIRARMTPLPFTPVPRVALRGDSLWVAEGYDPQLKLVNAAGQVVRTVNLPWRVRGSDAMWTQLETSLQEQKKNLQLEHIKLVPRENQVPSVAGLLMDDRGFLWVKEYDPSNDSIWLKRGDAANIGPGGLWRIMNPAGAWIAQVRIPANLMPLDIVGNRLLGVARDDLDVEHVVVFTITR
ncbi:MAG: hypothetical protein ACREMA_07480 [Longimicrobiales bacterium]